MLALRTSARQIRVTVASEARMQDHISLWGDLVAVPLRQYFVDANGIETRVVECGEGPPLVFVHGTGGHLEAYSRNIAALAADFRVITYDMAGHGFSEKPDRP